MSHRVGTAKSGARQWRVLLVLAVFMPVSVAWGPAGAHGQPIAYQQGASSAALSAQRSILDVRSHAPSDLPVPAPPAIGVGRFRYFPETGHFLRGVFLTYWETHGATAVLGLPITEALVEDGLTVQYLERARLEWHPQISPDPRRQVLLTRLGAILTEMRDARFPRLPTGSNTPTSVFFPQTGHNLANAFLSYWQRNGGLAVFGYPISEEIVEVNLADGRSYTVQYFERNRFEWHPELGPGHNVQLGLLGVEYARAAGLNPLARVLLPASFEGADAVQVDSEELAGLVDADLLDVMRVLANTTQFRWVPALIVRYNVRVEFADITEEDVAGAFITTRGRTRSYIILIPERYRGESVEALASVLAHEATHAYDAIMGLLSTRGCSIEAELRAYMNGLSAWAVLKGNGVLISADAANSFERGLAHSLRAFNANKDRLGLDFDPQQGRRYLQSLYGPDCGN
jgi:hypothetical protein